MSKIYTALGLMSGTSLDGVDVAIVYTDGETIHDWDVAGTFPYTSRERRDLQAYTDSALAWNFEGPPPNSFSAAETLVDDVHIRAIETFLRNEGIQNLGFDIIGYHGQTFLHDATRARTLQLGHGQALAHHFQVPVAYDFRSADVAAGGQGAPLAPIYHKALVEQRSLPGVTAVLNLGGVGNVSVVTDSKLLASDTGPANGPLDSFLESRGIAMDRDGAISKKGAPIFSKIDAWMQTSFFQRAWPKSADRYDFDVLSDLADVSTEEGAATLCAFSALSAAQTIRQMGVAPDRVIVCGGGRRNPTIMTMLQLELGCPVLPAEAMDWESDAIEAQAFGYLAVRVLRGLPNSFATTTGVPEPTVGGVIAYPRVKGPVRGRGF